MKLATLVRAEIEPSQSFKYQGNEKSMYKYRKLGYYPQYQNNGFLVMVKPSKVRVTLIDIEGNVKSFNMKEDILIRYQKQRITKQIVDRFVKEAEEGNITFHMNETSYSIN